MTYIARVILSGEGRSAYAVTGKGTTPEEAKLDCFEQIGAEILVELAQDVLIPECDLDKMPKELPSGCGLVIFVRHSHNSGDAYSYRFFAVKSGSYRLGNNHNERVVGPALPLMVSTLDSNSDVVYPLPPGSMEFYTDETWVPSTGVSYDY